MKKVVFPLEVLVPVALGSALFHAGVSLVVLIIAILAIHGGISWTALWLPVVIAPFCLMILGLGWSLASVGTFIRDIGQILGTVVTAMMFLTPIFFPLSALPDWLQPYLLLNPLTLPVTQVRDVLIFGASPDLAALGVYTIIATMVAVLGYQFFQKTRKGFADVL